MRAFLAAIKIHLFLFLLLISMGAIVDCAHSPPKPSSSPAEVERFAFDSLPWLKPGLVRLGGFSGLVYEGKAADGSLIFLTNTDRGPNREARPNPLPNEGKLRPFVISSFQPEWVRFSIHEGQAPVLLERLPLSKRPGQKLTGLPNRLDKDGDEVPTDEGGRRLPVDPSGLDLESLARDSDGSYWMGEEYRPSILHFDNKGLLLSRWIPNGNSAKYGTRLLPEHYRHRVPNRGFEGLAIDALHVYAFLQGALRGDANLARILKVDKSSGKKQEEFVYEFEPTPPGWPLIDKIGDAVSIGPGRFLVIEQNSATDAKAFRRIYEVDVRSATDVLKSSNASAGALRAQALCTHSPGHADCLHPVQKKLVMDLVEVGLRAVEKAEGLAVVDDRTLALVNDDDFGVGNPSPTAMAGTSLFLLHLPAALALETPTPNQYK